MNTRSRSRGRGKDKNSLTRGKRKPAKESSTSESESSEESTFTTLQKRKNCPRQRGKDRGRGSARGSKPPQCNKASSQKDTSNSESDSLESTKPRASSSGRKPPSKRTRASLQEDTSTSESDSSESTKARASTSSKKPPLKRTRASLQEDTSTSESDSSESTKARASTSSKKPPPKRTRASIREDTSTSESDSSESPKPRASTSGRKPPPKRTRASLQEDTSTSEPDSSESIEPKASTSRIRAATPNNHGNRKEPHSRTSERIRQRQNKEFHMPSRREVFEAIGKDGPPERQVRRVLASSFTRETHSYNQDRLSESDVSSVDDFIVNSDQVDTSSAEDVNKGESQPDRYRRLTNEQRRRLRPLEDEFDNVQRNKWKRISRGDPSSSDEETQNTTDVVNVSRNQSSPSDTSSSEETESADIPPQPPDTVPQTQALVPVTEACPQEPPQVVPYCDEDDSVYGEVGDPVAESGRGNIPETNKPHQTENSDQRNLQRNCMAGGTSSGTSRGTEESQLLALQPDDDLENLMLNLEEAVQAENKEQLEEHSHSEDAVSLLVVSSSEDDEVTSSRVEENVPSNQAVSTPDVVEVEAKPSCSNTSVCKTDDRQAHRSVGNPMVCDSGDDEALANISLQPEEETTHTSTVESQRTQAVAFDRDALADLSEQLIPAQRKANCSMVIESDSDSDEAQGSKTKPSKFEHSEQGGVSKCTVDNRKPSTSSSENNGDTSDEEIKHSRPNRSFVIESDESGVEQLNSSINGSESGSESDSDSEDERGRSKRARLMKSKKDAWREKFEQYKKARKKSNT